MGVAADVIAGAQFRSAATENRAFGIPPGTDYHGYVDGQRLPAWVRVGQLDVAYRARTLADFEGHAQINEAMFGATHLIQLVHGYGDGSERCVAAAVAELGHDYPVAWLDDAGVLRRP
ncbi:MULTISPECIES: hypothetical protein [Mycolicibacter]|uniref:Uncharacterized protein n=2 Tax=Mycolicibacter TaxID=1073531 RepID=A0ABU5XME4_9MYCO|nr:MULTISPECIES: hypothetical protein [unclassified Mycolicibacter]MEB3023437.1 hypothetical protein [Mycolicibacter sp. MYC098]MEB3033779.1 hypothetical protein [Mycolicibacter sp. MYC340]